MIRSHLLVSLLATSACLPLMQPVQSADPAAIKAQQRAGFAQSMGYPTRKTPDELDQAVAVQTDKFKRAGRTGVMQLHAPEPFAFDGKEGTCYTVVMRLGAGAAWGPAGDYMKFDFQRPEIAGTGGPGVVGPGAVASVGCAKSSGPITLNLASMIEGDQLGTGPLEMELYSRVLTRAEKQQLEEDERRQIAEQREFARQSEIDAERRRADDERRRADDQQRRDSRSSSSSSGSSGGGSSGPVSVTIRSSCSQTVPVFYGSNPKFGSGTKSSISSNSVQSHSFRVGDMFWVIDQSSNGLDSVTVSERTKTIEVTSSCSRLLDR